MRTLVLLALVCLYFTACRTTGDISIEVEENLVLRSYIDQDAAENLLKRGQSFTHGKIDCGELALIRIGELQGRTAVPFLNAGKNSAEQFYTAALKQNESSVEALYGLANAPRPDRHSLLQWAKHNATNGLPYYISAFNLLHEDPNKALKEIETGTRAGPIIHRPLYLRLGSKLGGVARQEAQSEWRTSPQHPASRFIRLQQVLQERDLSRAQVLHLLVLANKIATSEPYTTTDATLGCNLSLALLKSPIASKALPEREIQTTLKQREADLGELRRLGALDPLPESYIQRIKAETSALLNSLGNESQVSRHDIECH
jgi:hypothetical protein